MTLSDVGGCMKRRVLLTGSALVVIGTPAGADQPWQLVSPDEVRRDRAAGAGHEERPLTRGGLPHPGAPRILLQQPKADMILHAPLTFAVRFETDPGAAIDPRSFHATYGFLGIDITDRLLRHARVSGQGLDAEKVDVPAGDHRVTLTIADTLGRQASETFAFKVV